MQSVAAAADNHESAEPLHMTKRIGSTTYIITVYFSKTSKETIEDKILRLIEREAATH